MVFSVKLTGTPMHVLSIFPCDQAPAKRVFSMVNKIYKKFKQSVGNDTVCSLHTCKINSGVLCHKMLLSACNVCDYMPALYVKCLC